MVSCGICLCVQCKWRAQCPVSTVPVYCGWVRCKDFPVQHYKWSFGSLCQYGHCRHITLDVESLNCHSWDLKTCSCNVWLGGLNCHYRLVPCLYCAGYGCHALFLLHAFKTRRTILSLLPIAWRIRGSYEKSNVKSAIRRICVARKILIECSLTWQTRSGNRE